MTIHDMQQNTEEWFQIKVGKISASSADKLLTDRKNKGYIDLVKKIFEEQYTDEPCESKVWQGNSFTQRGHEHEPLAIKSYGTENFCDVVSVGFVELSEWVGCSPDGMIEESGLVQVKCPIFDTQIDYLSAQKVPGNYYKQMQFELYVTNRNWNDFYSWHPKLPPVQIRVGRDEIMIEQIELRINGVVGEVKNKIKKLS